MLSSIPSTSAIRKVAKGNMGSKSEFEENALVNIVRFATELQQACGGLSESPERNQTLDCKLHETYFYGFKLTNRNNAYHLLVPAARLPDSSCDDVVVILDGQQMLWGTAVSKIRSRRSELREALDNLNRPSDGPEATSGKTR